MLNKKTRNNGVFIVVDGPDGSGKGTTIRDIEKWICENIEEKPLITKEPGSPKDPICKKIREILLSPENEIDEKAEFFLYMADRAQHAKKILIPALYEEHKIVICDRYIYSTHAYQGYGRRVYDLPFIAELARRNCEYIPDLTIILLSDPKDGIGRISTSEFNGKKDRIEQESLEFHTKVFNGYAKILKDPSFSLHNFKTINTTKLNKQDARKQLYKYLEEFFEAKNIYKK